MKSVPKQYLECVLPETAGRFHYHLPEGLAHQEITPGARLLVPFGRGWKVAYFIKMIIHPDVSKTREVLALLDPRSLFRPKLFKLLFWISDYYQSPLGDVFKTALPQGIHVVPRRRFFLAEDFKAATWSGKSGLQREVVDLLLEKGPLQEQDLRKQIPVKTLGHIFSELKKKKILKEEWEITPPPVRPKFQKIAVLKVSTHEASALSVSLEKKAPRQAQALNQVISDGGSLPISTFDLDSRAAIKRLIKRGVVEEKEIPLLRKPSGRLGFVDKGVIHLNPEQSLALKEIKDAVQKQCFSPFLLHGVTGSGKTEVYLRAIEEVLDRGLGAILLLPEIGLTTHISARFLEYFGDRVALLHSGLSAGERYDEWRQIQEGKAQLVIGARSAIYAPLKNVGIIVVDEEHDASYRQNEGSRYHGRDVALVRGRDEKSVVVLGSATPCFESYFNAKNGKYHYLNLPSRIDSRPLPQVHLIDLKEKESWVRPFITKQLHDAIKSRIAQKEQVLLFMNRRGFSPSLLCYDCGFTPICRHCTVSLTYHKGLKRLVCHYCGFQNPLMTTCTDCRGINLGYMGIGTEQLEETISELFPDVRVARLDRDTTRKKGAYEQILSAMAREEIDILIGTQMIAKGHDFPKVTLVGVISADLSLYVPDFRASERTFQLLTQVSGRAGRGDYPGEVKVQTFQPENQSIQSATTYDYDKFYQEEMVPRKERFYPPYSRLTLLILRHRKESLAASSAASLAELIKGSISGQDLQVLGPAPASLLRLREEYRYQILLKGESQKKISTVLKKALRVWGKSKQRGTHLNIEIDPQQFV